MKKNELSFESSSFRDNFGNVFVHKDIFENYNETYFEKKLSEHTKILKKYNISKSGRVIFEYETL